VTSSSGSAEGSGSTNEQAPRQYSASSEIPAFRGRCQARRKNRLDNSDWLSLRSMVNLERATIPSGLFHAQINVNCKSVTRQSALVQAYPNLIAYSFNNCLKKRDCNTLDHLRTYDLLNKKRVSLPSKIRRWWRTLANCLPDALLVTVWRYGGSSWRIRWNHCAFRMKTATGWSPES